MKGMKGMKSEKIKENIILEKTYRFALKKVWQIPLSKIVTTLSIFL
jgi:hypothetical protein